MEFLSITIKFPFLNLLLLLLDINFRNLLLFNYFYCFAYIMHSIDSDFDLIEYFTSVKLVASSPGEKTAN